MISNMLIEYFAGLGLDVVKDKITSKGEAKKVEERITKYIESKRKENFICTREEEIDFEGLANYLRTDLLEDVQKKFFGTRKERQMAYANIMRKTAMYAQTKTQLSCKRALGIVSQALDILTGYYRSNINRDLRFLTGEIEDFIEEKHQESVKAINQIGSEIKENVLLSVDSSLQMIKSGKLDSVQERLTLYMDALSSGHILKPYYGFELGQGNSLRSVPLMPESEQLYPPRFDILATKITLGNTPIAKLDGEIFRKSYNHQVPIYFDVVNAKKFLGEVEDPIQTEAMQMIGKHAVAKPSEFPPPFPCSVSVGGEVYVDYLLLRTKEILDDGTTVLTNEEQDHFSYSVRLLLDFVNNRLKLNVTPRNPTNREHLKYKYFMKRVNAGEKVTLKILSLNQILVSGMSNSKDSTQLHYEIEFLEKIVAIEDYFKTQISLPEVITIEDNNVINQLVDLINDSYKGSWRQTEFTFVLTEETKHRIAELTEEPCDLLYTGREDFEIFDQTFSLPIMRRVKNAKILDLEKTKLKSEILDVGDDIKIRYIPGSENGEYIDQKCTENIEQALLFADLQEN